MDRFDEFIEPVPESGCWIWTGTEFANGYGRFGDQRAHRVAYERVNGAIPDGLLACHKCDTRLCVNPAHIFIGDTDANMADMVAKGRSAHGTRHGRAKLTQEQVATIRAAAGKVRDIAASFGVSKSLVSMIRRGEIWGRV